EVDILVVVEVVPGGWAAGEADDLGRVGGAEVVAAALLVEVGAQPGSVGGLRLDQELSSVHLCLPGCSVVACHLCYTDRLKVAIHYVMILSMSSQHAEPAITVRAPKDLSDEAKDVLKARGRTMRAFVVACLTRLTTDSGNFLALL